MVRLPAQPLYFIYKGYEYERNKKIREWSGCLLSHYISSIKVMSMKEIKKIREHILCALVGETGFEQWKVLIYLVASS
jgi:hypothetical protein